MNSFYGILFESKYGKCYTIHMWNSMTDAEIGAQAAGHEGNGSRVWSQYFRTLVLEEEAIQTEYRNGEKLTSFSW